MQDAFFVQKATDVLKARTTVETCSQEVFKIETRRYTVFVIVTKEFAKVMFQVIFYFYEGFVS